MSSCFYHPASTPWSTGFGKEDSLSPWGVCILLELRNFFSVFPFPFPKTQEEWQKGLRGITRGSLQRPNFCFLGFHRTRLKAYGASVKKPMDLGTVFSWGFIPIFLANAKKIIMPIGIYNKCFGIFFAICEKINNAASIIY